MSDQVHGFIAYSTKYYQLAVDLQSSSKLSLDKKVGSYGKLAVGKHWKRRMTFWNIDFQIIYRAFRTIFYSY